MLTYILSVSMLPYNVTLRENVCHTISGTLSSKGWPYFIEQPRWPPNIINYNGYYDVQTAYGYATTLNDGTLLPVCSCIRTFGSNIGRNPGCIIEAKNDQSCYDLSWVPFWEVNKVCPSLCSLHGRTHLRNICIPRNNNENNIHGMCVCNIR